MLKPARFLCLTLCLLAAAPAAASPTSGTSRWLRGTLNPFFVPRWLRPEVFRSSGDPTLAMIARCAALEGKLPSLDELTVEVRGEAFGQAFLRHLEHRFGRETVDRLRQKLSDTPWIGVERAVSQATGEALSTLWQETLDGLRGESNRRAEAIRKAGETRSTLLTAGGFHSAPRFLPDGSLLSWEGNEHRPGRLLLQAPGKTSCLLDARRLGTPYLNGTPEHLSLTPDGRFLFLTISGDCFRFDLETKDLRRLPVGKVREVEAAPGGDRLLVIRPNGKKIELLDADGRTLQSFPMPKGASGLAWAPDGSKVALSLGGSLALLEPESGEIETIRGEGGFQDPAWSPDSRWLFCSSARSGIFNLYAHYRETGFLYRVTNVIGGAFQPAVAPDFRRIAFVGYSAQNYDLREMPLEQSGWRAIKPSETVERSENFLEEEAPHRFRGSVGWGLGTPRPSFDLAYQCSPLGLRVTDDSLHTYAGKGEIWQRRQLYEASVTWNKGLKLTGGYRYRSASLLEGAPGPVPGGTDHLLFASYALEDTYRPRLGISPEEGRVAGLSLEHALSGSYDRLGLDVRLYQPLGNHRVLAMRAVAGLNAGSSDGNFRVGGELGPELGSLSLLPLRGYPVGILSGAKALSLQADVRFPLGEVQRGLVDYPVALSRVSGAFFWEGGTASDQDFFPRFRQGVGGEIQGHSTILDVRFDLRVGLAYGLASDGGWRPYFSFNTPF